MHTCNALGRSIDARVSVSPLLAGASLHIAIQLTKKLFQLVIDSNFPCKLVIYGQTDVCSARVRSWPRIPPWRPSSSLRAVGRHG